MARFICPCGQLCCPHIRTHNVLAHHRTTIGQRRFADGTTRPKDLGLWPRPHQSEVTAQCSITCKLDWHTSEVNPIRTNLVVLHTHNELMMMMAFDCVPPIDNGLCRFVNSHIRHCSANDTERNGVVMMQMDANLRICAHNTRTGIKLARNDTIG